MATPPGVPNAELAATLHRIANRRVKAQDSALEHLPDSDQTHPCEMLEFLRRYPTTVPRRVQQADVTDALRLTAWLGWAQRREEYSWRRQGRRLGLFLSQLVMPLDIGKRGVLDRMDRATALLRYDQPDE